MVSQTGLAHGESQPWVCIRKAADTWELTENVTRIRLPPLSWSGQISRCREGLLGTRLQMASPIIVFYFGPSHCPAKKERVHVCVYVCECVYLGVEAYTSTYSSCGLPGCTWTGLLEIIVYFFLPFVKFKTFVLQKYWLSSSSVLSTMGDPEVLAPSELTA